LLKIREPFNALSHLAGAAIALPGTYMLLVWGGTTPARFVSLLIYGASLMGMFTASGVYHAVDAEPRIIARLRKVDHSAIYLLIVGTYTPLCVIAFTGFWQWGMLTIIWSLALVGIVVKMFTIHAPRWFAAGVYLAMGWLSLIAVSEILQRLAPSTIIWLAAGGLLYTLGAVIYITKKGNFFPGVFGFHELWHVFVLLGAGAHFMAVASIL
jgi:hemolysin III